MMIKNKLKRLYRMMSPGDVKVPKTTPVEQKIIRDAAIQLEKKRQAMIKKSRPKPRKAWNSRPSNGVGVGH